MKERVTNNIRVHQGEQSYCCHLFLFNWDTSQNSRTWPDNDYIILRKAEVYLYSKMIFNY